MSLSSLNSTEPIDLEQLATDVYEAVRWAALRYQNHIRRDEYNDLSQEIFLKLVKDNCRLLRSFKHQSSPKTWLQKVVNNHVCNHFHRRKQTESRSEIDQWVLTYSPPQDVEIYAAEKRKLLVRAVGRLSEQERLLYQLCYISEMETHKIAAVFETDVRNVHKRKHLLALKLTRIVQAFQSH